MSKKMNQERQLQYYAKIAGALNLVFDEESEFYIDIYDDEFVPNDFLHVLGTRVPQRVFLKLTSEETDPLGFNHILNRLIFQSNEDCNT